ncbi:MAG: transglutaminase domain-containing protein, partial [Phycisphaerales bacterium]|nr:transglutaminase domain-containing protein [Phycisphaerales bacterium]
MTVFTRLGSYQAIRPERDGPRLEFDVWEFDAATLVYPALGATASSILEVRGPSDEEVPAVSGKVELNDRIISDEFTVLKQGIGGGPLPAGTWRAQWQIPPAESGSYTARELDFEVTISQSCYRTEFDERRAAQLDWPEGPWPPEAEATFQPQMFVDFDAQGQGYDMAPVLSLLDKWAEGRSVEEMRNQAKPVMLAKWLAGQTITHVQTNGEGLAFDKTGLWQGFDTEGAAVAAATGRGTEIDLPCLLVAIYRAVGIPARVVIGFDEESEGKNVYLKQGDGSGQLRVWVEFALYDEDEMTFGWVPVDPTQYRRKRGNRLPNGYLQPGARFEYFGSHDEL